MATNQAVGALCAAALGLAAGLALSSRRASKLNATEHGESGAKEDDAGQEEPLVTLEDLIGSMDHLQREVRTTVCISWCLRCDLLCAPCYCTEMLACPAD